MSESVSVSVIIPIYNGERYLDSCLTAIRQSAYAPYEIIVVDNGSTDDSVETARRHGIGVVSCPGPSGPGAARNRGAHLAKGQILLFVDADVVIKPDTLSRVVATFQEQPDVAAVFGSYDDRPAAQNFLSQYKNLVHHFVHQHARTEASTFWGGCGAIRKEIFHKIGGYDQAKYPTASVEDIEMGARMHRSGYRIMLDKQVQVKHLKEWRLISLLRTDIFCRAIPWTKLILESQETVNDLNLHTSQRISAGLVGIAVMLAPLAFVEPLMSLALLLPLGLILTLNRRLFGFFLRHKGFQFAASAFPIHLLYFFYSGVIFATYWACYCLPTRAANPFMWLEKWRGLFSRTSEPIDHLEVKLPASYNLGDAHESGVIPDPLRKISTYRSALTRTSLRIEPSVNFSTFGKALHEKETGPFDCSTG